MSHHSAGRKLREALAAESPLQVAGTLNAYSALLAERAGFRAIYLSGAGVANASFGLPDLGITTLNDVCEDVRRITDATPLPLLVDADTGWGGAFQIARTIRELVRAGAAGCHLEDQAQAKRCGHRPNKQLVETSEMCDRIKAAVDARPDPDFVVMARTDAHASEGQSVIYGIRPEHLAIASEGEGLATEVVVVEPTGADTQVFTKIAGVEVTSVFRERHTFTPGSTIHLQPDASRAHLFDATSGKALTA